MPYKHYRVMIDGVATEVKITNMSTGWNVDSAVLCQFVPHDAVQFVTPNNIASQAYLIRETLGRR